MNIPLVMFSRERSEGRFLESLAKYELLIGKGRIVQMSRHGRIIAIFTAVLTTAITATSISADAKNFYQGKSVTVLVGLSAGGGTDTAARVFARGLARHIPGSPKVIVKNLTGAGGMKMLNFVYEAAPKDGSTIMFTGVSIADQLLGRKGMRFDYRAFSIVGAQRNLPLLSFVRTDVIPGGMKDSADIVKAKNLKYGGNRPLGGTDMVGRTALDVLGLDFTYIPGYRGGAKARAAMLTGEVNVSATGFTAYRSSVEPTYVKDGTMVPLWYFPAIDSSGNFLKAPKAVGAVKNFVDVYRKIRGKEPSGPYWEALKFALQTRGTLSNVLAGPPGMNKEALAVLRESWRKTIKDPRFAADQMKIFGFTWAHVPLDAATKALANLDKYDPKVIAFWKKYAASRGKKK